MARGQAAAAALNALRDAEAREREIREQEKWRQRDERLAQYKNARLARQEERSAAGGVGGQQLMS